MRVLQLGPFPPPHGGIQTNLVAIRECLRSRGIPCGAINLTRHRKANSDEVYYPAGALQLIRLLLTVPPAQLGTYSRAPFFQTRFQE